MKDLFVYAADADAVAFLNAILNKPEALGIRKIRFDIDRNGGRDSGMIKNGAEFVRTERIKNNYRKVILMWDHHGSGRERRQKPLQVSQEIQDKLDSFTWEDNSATIVLNPELEQWLWHCEQAVAKHFGMAAEQLQQWCEKYAGEQGVPPADIKKQNPKGVFQYIMDKCLDRSLKPRDFEEIGRLASIKGLQDCESFRKFTKTLQGWFAGAGE